MTPGPAAAAYRLAVGALALIAVGYQLLVLHLPNGYDPVNFFSYFTNLTNILVGVVFIATAIQLLRSKLPTPFVDAMRGATVLYIVFVGLVFGALLQDVPVGNLQPWVNTVVHYITPVAAVADWLLWPPRRRIPFDTALLWLIWPAVYSGYILIRGAITGFYPYPFFNPAASGGFGVVAATLGAMVVALLLMTMLVRLPRRWHTEPAAKHLEGPRRRTNNIR